MAHEETTANVKFLFIDCGPLKQALSSHCDLWRGKLAGLLNKQAAAELKALHDTFRLVCVVVSELWCVWGQGLQAGRAGGAG